MQLHRTAAVSLIFGEPDSETYLLAGQIRSGELIEKATKQL